MPGVVYGCFKRACMRGEINLEKDALRCMLATAEYKPDAADDAAARIPEVEGKGYREGGKRLTGCRVAEGGDDGAFHADDLEWPDATIAARWAVVYRGGDGLLVACVSLGGEVSSNNGPFRVAWDKDGIFTLS